MLWNRMGVVIAILFSVLGGALHAAPALKIPLGLAAAHATQSTPAAERQRAGSLAAPADGGAIQAARGGSVGQIAQRQAQPGFTAPAQALPAWEWTGQPEAQLGQMGAPRSAAPPVTYAAQPQPTSSHLGALPPFAPALPAGQSPSHPAHLSPNAASALSTTHIAYEFGQAALFTATLTIDQPLQMARVFIQEQSQTRTRIGEGRLESGSGGPQLRYTLDLTSDWLRPFTWVEYHWEVTLQDGQLLRSPNERFYYRDNRFAWNMLEEKPFRVFWYEGDVDYAQAILDTAQQGVIQVQSVAPLPVPPDLDMYIYPDYQALQSALSPSSAAWVAGHADPDLGVIVAAIPPGFDQQTFTEQRIPHELMHILLYQYTRPGYRSLPTWLNEGMASQAELYPNSDYKLVLDDAVQRGALIPMTELCGPFPRDASQALLAYAQSASFVDYIHRTYGGAKLQTLISTYANGLSCERGAQQALGRSLTQLERGWQREALSVDITAATAANLLPWVVLLLVALLTPILLIMLRNTTSE